MYNCYIDSEKANVKIEISPFTLHAGIVKIKAKLPHKLFP